MTEQQLKPSNKNVKNPDSRKGSTTSHNSASGKRSRKAENPNRFIPPKSKSDDIGCATTVLCKNSACRDILSICDSFCRRCSCCICYKFDDNKDPSLWLVCEESTPACNDACGRSCHIECAFQKEKLGVVNVGQYMPLDGEYCCAYCGKVQGILGCWKKQVAMAKDARRIDVLCYRIFLSYRLLEGSSRFKECLQIITEAKTKLEAEVGPLNGESVKMARGIVSRLSVAGDLQKLCSRAIEKADEFLAKRSSGSPNIAEGPLPAVFKFLFEEITSSSLAIVVVEIPPFTNQIIGYKLWYSESKNEIFPEEPLFIFMRENRRIVVNNLQPSTEYTFRVASYTEAGDLGYSEAKCFTKSVEIINKSPSCADPVNDDFWFEGSSSGAKEQLNSNPVENSGVKVPDLGIILQLAWAQEQGPREGFCFADKDQCSRVTKCEDPKDHQSPPVSRELDLNVVASVPDLNEDLSPPIESSRDEDNGCSLERINGPDDDAASHGIEKNGMVRSNGSEPSDNKLDCTHTQNGDMPDSVVEAPRKASSTNEEPTRKKASSNNGEAHDADSGLVNGLARPNGNAPSDDSPAFTLTRNGGVPADDSVVEARRKRVLSANEEPHDDDSGLVNGSPSNVLSQHGILDKNFEYIVGRIRMLEIEGYFSSEFRCKFLTWYSLESSPQDRLVVHTYIRTLADDPKSLAGQLFDTYGDIVLCKKPKNSFTSPP